jgi:hypothetical protein
MAKRFVVPFASTGDKTVTPDATDPAGAISYSQGWGAQYQLPDTDPSYRPVGRQEMNGVLFDVTGAVAELQTIGFPEWVAVAGLVVPYRINAYVRHSDIVYKSVIANNSSVPGANSDWLEVISVVQATEIVAGVAEIATLAEVTAGTDDARTVTAKKLRDAGFARTVKTQSLSASGTYTPSAGMVFCIVEFVGGGGGGGGCTGGSGTSSTGGGGQGGGYQRKLYTAAQIGASRAVTIGAAGAAGNAGASGGNGGDTVLAGLLTAGGGQGGLFGSAGSAIALSGSGGTTLGAATGGDLSIPGQKGDTGLILGSTNGGKSGYGGGSPFGPITPSGGPVQAGFSGVGKGTGGSGGACTSVSQVGGPGTIGYFVVTEFCTQ